MTKHQHRTFASAKLERKDNTDDPAKDTAEIKKALSTFMGTFDAFAKKTGEEVAELKKKGSVDYVTTDEVKKLNDALDEQKKLVDDLRMANARPQISGADGQKRALTQAEIDHKAAFLKFMRKGDDAGLDELQKKAISIGSEPDGGYTVHAQMETAIDRVLSQVSPIRSIASVMQISTAVLKRPINVGGTGTGWVGETSGRPETNTPTLRERQFPVMELYAMPAATQSLLDDSVVNLEAWLADEVNITFAEQEGLAFVMGNGVDRPKGFVGGYTPVADTSFTEAGGAPGYIPTGAAGAFKTTAPGDDGNNIVDLVYSLKSAYRQNARFVMNRKTQAAIRKMRDSTGQMLWQPGLQAGQPASLLGYAITEAEDMPDIAANSFSIAFGDFQRSYLIVDRVGIRVLRDPFSSKPYILFYTTKRVGGGVKLFEGYKLLRFATT